MPIFAVPLAKFAVSFAPQKGDFIGRKPLEQQFAAFKRIMNRDFSDLSVLPHRIQPITLLDRGVMRAGMPVYRGEKQVGWVTSGTMVPYYVAEGEACRPSSPTRRPSAPSACATSTATSLRMTPWRSISAASGSRPSFPRTT